MQRGAPVAGTGRASNHGNSDVNRLIREARREGAIIKPSKHGIKVWHPTGRGPVLLTTSISASQRTQKNGRSALRRIGFRLGS